MAKMLKEGLSGVTEKDEIEDVTRQYEWDSNEVNERDWKKVLEGYKKWELKEMIS